MSVRQAELALRVSGAQEADRQLQIVKHNLREMATRTDTLSGRALPNLATQFQNQGKVAVNAARQYRTLSNTLGRYARLTRQLSIGIFIIGMVMRRTRDATWALDDAERAYMETLEKHGKESKEMADATRNLERARVRLSEAQTQAGLTLATYAVNLGLVIAQTYAAITATRLKTAVDAAETVGLWAKFTALSAVQLATLGVLGVVAGAAVVGTAYLATRPKSPGVQPGEGGSKAAINIENLNVRDDGQSLGMFLEDMKNRSVVFSEAGS